VVKAHRLADLTQGRTCGTGALEAVAPLGCLFVKRLLRPLECCLRPARVVKGFLFRVGRHL
jgi:hypothetical protein